MTDEDFELNPQNVRDYLAAQGFMRGEDESLSLLWVAAFRICAAGGVAWADASVAGSSSNRSEKLRVKDDWRSDRSRIYREAESIRAMRPGVGSGGAAGSDSYRF